MVCAPESAVISLGFRPFRLNREVRLLRLEDPGGRSVVAALRLAVLASLLPSGTVHEGPPSYM